ncbi:Tim44 domain-containing protein [Pseudothauera nasutitermitis]|uniref:Tim44 domain-containing protein n=1 Tax=Pseudothauera nasutitermitis TaxID=2565930 RepID=A0A4S4AXE8_9RHOO|nr:TIM44-like domain-containing protein [Pseudothauera nasutitermitis]THF64765.1 Tim44 domain-containing protein [Pseudothauera nasutitermitis]
MKQLLLTLFVTVLTFGLAVPEAEARRFGGGSSFGMQRQATPPAQAPRQAATPQRQTQPAAAQGAQPRSSWMGPIAGLAAGLGLAALFSHLGLGEEFGSLVLMLLMAGAAFFLFRMFFRRPAAQDGRLQYAGGADAQRAQPAAFDAGRPVSGGASAAFGTQEAAPAGAALPADFDAEGFARQAKVQFIRLQAAYDSANLDDIREFTTPEVFGEIRLQLAERGAAEQRTDVVELNAEVVEVAEEDKRWIVSVRFNGLLREEAGAAPAPFDEIWHLTKAKDGNAGWVIAGIQQVG